MEPLRAGSMGFALVVVAAVMSAACGMRKPAVPTGGPSLDAGGALDTTPSFEADSGDDANPRVRIDGPCAAGAECSSGFCVEGICCNTACAGPCRSCKLVGMPGRCTLVQTGAADPRGVCQAEDVATCGHNGRCDGQGACASYPDATACGDDRSCRAGVCEANSDGGAVDRPPTTAPTGARCADDAECSSGFCVQGFCCNTACTGPCRACNLAGRLGSCTLLDAGAMDPRGLCQAEAPSTCGFTGRCDGQGACARYAAGTECAASGCNADGVTFESARVCDGSGVCRPATPAPCHPYKCSATTNRCAGSCATDDDCLLGRCLLQRCSVARDDPCIFGSECASGFCAQGVCCDSVCAGPCRACNLIGTMGVCTAVRAGLDPQGFCAVQAVATCGTTGACDAQGGCARFAEGSVCGAGRTCQTGACQSSPDGGS